MANGQFGTVFRYIGQLVGAGEMGDQTDGQLLESFACSHEAVAFEALVQRHAPLVWNLCRRILRDEHEAEDVFQATFLVLVKKAPTLDRRGSLGNWLYTVAYHLALKARTKAARQRTQEKETADMVQTASTRDDSEELHAVLDEELHRLPAKYRGPLVLCYLQGKTNEEAARELSCPPGSMSHYLSQARALLRKRLARRGVALAPALLVPALANSANAAVPPSIILAAAQAGLLYAAGQTATGTLSVKAVVLAEGIVRAMLLAKLKMVAAITLAIGMLAAGAGVLVQRMAVAQDPAVVEARPSGESAKEPEGPRAEPRQAKRVDRYGDPLPPGVRARLGTVRLRPGKQVVGLAVAPGGRVAASACETGLHLWDLTTGRQIRELSRDTIQSVSFSSDGAILFGNNWKTITAGDVASGKALREYRPADQKYGIQTFALSPDGKLLAIGGPADTIELLSVASGKQVRAISCGCQQNQLLFSPDSRSLVSQRAMDGFGIPLWDVATGSKIRSFPAARHGAWSFAFSPDGKTVGSVGALYGDNGITKSIILLFDVANGQERHRMEFKSDFPIYAIAFSPEGKVLASGNNDEILLWDPTTGKKLGRLEETGVHCLAFTPQGGTLVSGSNNGAIRLWDVAAMKERVVVEGGSDWVDEVGWLADGNKVATHSLEGLIRIWDAPAGRELYRFRPPQGCLSFSPDRRTLAVVGKKDIHYWNLDTGKELRRSPHRLKEPRTVVFAPTGKLLAIEGESVAGNPVVWLWDVAAGKVVHEFRLRPKAQLATMAFSPDGTCLAIGDSGATVYLGDCATGKELQVLSVRADRRAPNVSPFGGDYVDSLAFSGDGKTLAAGGTSSSIHVWELPSGREVRRLTVRTTAYRDQFRILRLAFSADDRMLAGSGFGCDIRLWEMASGKEFAALTGHRGGVRSLAFSPNGGALLSGSQDTTALLWEFAGLGFIPADRTKQPATWNVDALWQDLGNTEPTIAYRAAKALLTKPKQSAAFLAGRMQPTAKVDVQRLAKLVAELQSNRFQTRQQAEEELLRGEGAEAVLEKALADKPTLEVRNRLERILDQLKQPITHPKVLRDLRGVTVLENLATPEAQRILRRLSTGSPEAKLTREAKDALRRIASGA